MKKIKIKLSQLTWQGLGNVLQNIATHPELYKPDAAHMVMAEMYIEHHTFFNFWKQKGTKKTMAINLKMSQALAMQEVLASADMYAIFIRPQIEPFLPKN